MAEKLNADLNIIQRSGIEITVDPITADLNIIQKLDDEPNDVGGLSAAELKAKFDEAGNTIKDFINGSLIPQVVGADAVEQVREENEAARVAAETAREQAEAARAAAETEREENETARVAAETARETAFDAAQEERAAAFDEAQASRAAVFSAGEEARNFWDDYDPTKDYVPGNKVYYLGSSYVNKVPCRDVLPTVEDNWQMIAKKGADSDEGLSQEEADLRYLQLAGGKMTGAVEVLEPEKGAQPATKHYTDTCDASTLSAAKRYADGKVGQYGYSKEETLKAETAAIVGMDSTAVPDDMFYALAWKAFKGTNLVALTVLDEDGEPVDGVKIAGATALDGSALVTGDDGTVQIPITQDLNLTLTTDYLDIQHTVTQAVTYTAAQFITPVTVTMPWVDFTEILHVTTSGNYRVKKERNVLACAVGGGQAGYNGENSKYLATSSGGAGGTLVGKKCNMEMTLLPGTTYEAAIAAGGRPSGGLGGETTFHTLSSADGTASTAPLLDPSLAGKYGSGVGGNGGNGTNSGQTGGSGSAGTGNSGGGGGGGTGGRDGGSGTIAAGGSGGIGGPSGGNPGNPGQSGNMTGGKGGAGGAGGAGGLYGGCGGGGGGAGVKFLQSSPVAAGGAGGVGGSGVLLVKFLDEEAAV